MLVGVSGNEVTIALFIIVARLVIPCIAAYLVHRKGYPREWVFITVGILFSGLAVLIIALILPPLTEADASDKSDTPAPSESSEAAA